MKRAISIAICRLLAASLLVPMGFVCMLGLFFWSVAGPNPETVLARAQPVCEPITVALGEYHRRHDLYPQALSDLIKEGFLNAVPELPPQGGTSDKYGPIYDVNTSLDFYRLYFGYCVEYGIGPCDTYWRVFVSDDPNGWKSDRPDSMEEVVADRLLVTYRERHDGRSLELFMSDVIGKADCFYLNRDRVIRWLGEGIEIELPPDLLGAGKKGYVYHTQNDAKRRYCFVYKDQWLPVPQDWLPAHERGKFIDKNYPVLDKLLLVQEVEGQSSWTVIRDCPKSLRDQRAIKTP